MPIAHPRTTFTPRTGTDMDAGVHGTLLDNLFSRKFPTIADAQSALAGEIGEDTIYVAGAETEGIGGGMYRRVAAAPAHAGWFAAGGVNYELAEDAVTPEMFAGADDAAKIKAAIEFGAHEVHIDGSAYSFTSVAAVLTASTKIVFGKNFKATRSAQNAVPDFWHIDTNGKHLDIHGYGTIDGASRAPVLMKIINSTTTESRVSIYGGPKLINAKRLTADGNGAAIGLRLEGLIDFRGSAIYVDGVGRDAGIGTPEVTGSDGISISSYNVGGVNQWPTGFIIYGCTTNNVGADDPAAIDCDGVKVFDGASDPANAGLRVGKCRIHDHTAHNCRGRALKLLCASFEVTGLDYSVDGIAPIAGGHTGIGVQSNARGEISGVTAVMRGTTAGGTNPFNGGYQGSIVTVSLEEAFGRSGGNLSIRGVQVDADTDAGTGYSHLVLCSRTGAALLSEPAVLTMSDFGVRAETAYFLKLASGTASRRSSLENIWVNDLLTAAIDKPDGINADGNSVMMTNCGHHGATERLAVRDSDSVPAVTGALVPVDGRGLVGIQDRAPAMSSANLGHAAQFVASMFPPGLASTGGIHLGSVFPADAGYGTFDLSGYFPGNGWILLTVSWGTLGANGLFRADGTNLEEVSPNGASIFSIGNNATNGVVNTYLFNQQLWVNPRLGSGARQIFATWFG